MIGWIVRMIGGVLRGSSMHRHPSAIAMAMAFGLAIGLMPKDNLLVLSLAAVVCFLRINYLLTVAMTVLVSASGWWTDGLTGRLGQWMLESTALQSFWTSLASWPILPWFRWNNSLVLGGLLAGVASFLPSYVLCLLVARRFALYRTQSRVDAIVDEMQAYQHQIRSEQSMRQMVKAINRSNTDRWRSSKQRDPQRYRIDASPESEVVKPKLTEVCPEPAMAVVKSALPATAAILHETVIEIVRYRPKNPSLSTSGDDTRNNQQNMVRPESLMNTKALEDGGPASTKTISENADLHPTLAADSHLASSANIHLGPTENNVASEKPREEALRYLLWHLSGMHRGSRHQEPVT